MLTGVSEAGRGDGTTPVAEDQPAPQVAPWWMIAGAGIFAQFLTTVGGVLAARMLGVDGRGTVVLVSTIAAMASQLTLGGSLPNAVTKQLAERDLGARDGLHGLVRRWAPLGLAAATFAGGYLLFLEWGDGSGTAWALAACTLAWAIQQMASRILMGAMLGERTNPIHIALTGVLPQAVVVAAYAIGLALGAGWNAVELLLITILCNGLVLIGRLRVLRKPTRRPEDRLDAKELHALARKTHIGSVGPIDGLGLDRMLVGSLLGSTLLGLYSVAVAFSGLTQIFAVCLALVALPQIASLQKDPEAEAPFVRRWVLTSAGMLVVVVGALELVLVPVLKVTFGEDFIDATDSTRWMLVASGLLGFRRVLIAVLQGRDRGRVASVTELALTPLMILGIVLAAAEDSLVAVGVTMVAVGAASCLVLGFFVLRSAATGIDVRLETEPQQA